MFNNMIDQKLYVQEVIDPESKKDYLVHIYYSIANMEPLEGFHCIEFYITDKNPHHGLLVNYGRRAFTPEEFEAEKATDTLEQTRLEGLSDGIKRFEAIMAHGISGNELE